MKYLLFILLFAFTNGNSQVKTRFTQLGTDKGLSQNVVYCIFQDKKGFIWAGTHDGLNRFDGYEFQKYYHNPEENTSLGDNTVYQITDDKAGNLWVLTMNFLHKLDVKKKIFIRYKLPDFITTDVPTLNEEAMSGEYFCFSGPHTMFVFNFTKNKFYKLPPSLSLTPLFISNNKEAKDFFTPNDSGNGLLTYNKKNGRLESIVTGSLAYLNKHKIVFTKIYGENDFYAITTNNELVIKKSNENIKIIKVPFPKKQEPVVNPINIEVDNDGNIFIATSNAIFCYSKISDQVMEIMNRDSNEALFSNNIKCILTDKYDNLWVGTFGNGLARTNLQIQQFNNLSPASAKPNLFPGKFVKSIKEDIDGNVYVSFYETNVLSKISNDWGNITNSEISTTLSNKKILTQIYLEAKEITNNKPLFDILSKKNQLWTTSNPLFFQTNQGNYWLKTESFIQNFNNSDLIITPGTFIQSISIDNKDNIWMGTSGNGLILIDNKTLKQTAFKYNSKTNSICNNTINALLFDKENNRLFIGTNSGLCIYSIEGNSFKSYKKKDGLSHDNIYSLTFGDYGRLWLGTGNGLSMMDTLHATFTNFNKSDGLINAEFNRDCAIKKMNGEMVFGGTEGIDYFTPVFENNINNPPIVEITDFVVSNKSKTFSGNISLTHNENNLSIAFSAMDFTNPSKNIYAYRLKGRDRDWTYIESQRIVSFASLSSGNYIFEVKAANGNRVWNDSTTLLKFTIHPPWWNTKLFYGIIITLIALAVYTLFKYRFRKKLEVLHIRSRIHRDLHDDVGATLSTVKAYTEMLKSNPEKTEYLELITENTNEMLEKLEIIAWASNPQNDSFKKLLEKMKMQTIAFFYHKGVELEFNSDSALNDIELPGTVRQNLFLIFKESTNNIIKHASANFCRVTFKRAPNKIIMKIEDDGIGIQEPVNSHRSGLENIKKRANEINAICNIISENGTTIEISVPFPFKIVNTTAI